MIHKTLHYWQHRLLSKQNMRLAMTLLVKNESDIIEENIHFHAQQGVDCFAVMDNNSDDGTREILSKLSTIYDIHIIDQPEQNYQQAKWMTNLAFVARDKLKANLVISNDADEFWQPAPGTQLKDHLHRNDSVVTVSRYNMALSERALEPDYRFKESNLVVKNPVFFDKKTQIDDLNIAMLLIKISPQTIVNPYGLWRLKGGNHRAKHAWNLINKRSESSIKVYHYPIRSYSQFEANIKNRERLLLNTNARMGDHYRRWVNIYQKGLLKEEFSRFTLTDSDIKTLVKIGVIEQYNPFEEHSK